MSDQQFARTVESPDIFKLIAVASRGVCRQSLAWIAPLCLSDLQIASSRKGEARWPRQLKGVKQDLSLIKSKSHIYQPISRSLGHRINIVPSQSCKVWSVGRSSTAPFSSHRLHRRQELFTHPCERRTQKPRTARSTARIPHQSDP